MLRCHGHSHICIVLVALSSFSVPSNGRHSYFKKKKKKPFFFAIPFWVSTHTERQRQSFNFQETPTRIFVKQKTDIFVKVGFVKKEEEEKEIKVSPSSPFAQRERYLRENFQRERERVDCK